ncbi:MAG: hypothetical protein GC138_08705 [Gammaproteobacteria bacterium]|nr:hypothetical protein [Gammaproteobacteria bacterium]
MRRLAIAPIVFAGMFAGAAAAVEPIGIEGTTIIGNRELPKVLYIVPWKHAEPGNLVVRPFSSLYDQTLEPVDREVLLRRLDYFNVHDQAHQHQRGE